VSRPATLVAWPGLVQVTLISGLPPSPAPAAEVHARPVAGIRPAHHRSAGTGPAQSESAAGHRGPRHPGPARPAALGEVTQRATRSAGGALPAEVQVGARQRTLRPCPGRTQESPVTSPASASPSPGRTTTATEEASGSVNRSSCPDSVRHMSVTTAMQRLTVTHHDTRCDSTKTAREPGYAQAAGRFRRWWQVLGSNQRRLSRRFYRPPAKAFRPAITSGRAVVWARIGHDHAHWPGASWALSASNLLTH
jgi:hypothetical protein